MHIGVDATCWLLPRGFGRHTRCLLTALRQVDTENAYTFFTDSASASDAVAAVAPVRLVPTSTPTIEGAAVHGRRKVSDLVAMSRAMADRSIDLLLFPTTYSYVPVVSRSKKLMIIHDVTAERFPALTLDSRRARWSWSLKSMMARRQADAIVTVSEYSRDALVAEFGFDPGRIHVVGEASDPVFQRLEHAVPTPALVSLGLTGARRYIVYVGGFSPHKNLPQLVRAFGLLAERTDCADVDLVLVGGYEHETFFTAYPETRERIESLGLNRRVILTGFLPDSDLVVLLNMAIVLALPSMTEGFGLPAIEAAACGCPVIATAESPLPRLLGEAGCYIDPRDPAALVNALGHVVTSSECQALMRRAGLAAASRLTWTAAASDLLALMRSTMLQ
jgi:glycosyltransferase involved in cell wall biosynthesis